MIIPHEFGHTAHFCAVSRDTRVNYETQYLAFLATHAKKAYHDVDLATTPYIAFIEAVDIFSERFFFFKKRVRPDLDGVALRQAFFRDELDHQTLTDHLNEYVIVGTRSHGVIAPELTGAKTEGAIYGAIYLDFARRIGLREAVGLVLDSQVASFDEFHTYVQGRGNDEWLTALKRVEDTWKL